MNHLWVVTGAAGFIGGRLATALQEKGHAVIAVDQPEAFAKRIEFKDRSFDQQLTPESFLEQLAAKKLSAVSGILHMGAITSTLEFDETKLRKANLEYSQALWEICTDQRIALFYASSAATYGGGEAGYSDQPRGNWDALQPLNPYGWSKHRFDLWVRQRIAAGLTPPRFAGFKFFNVYGFGEGHKGRMASVVWHAYQQILSQGHVTLFRSHRAGIADGHQKRDFVSVEDVVHTVLSFAQDPALPSGIYNLGSGKARSFLDLAHAVFAALGRPVAIQWQDTPVELRDKYQYFTEADLTYLRAQGYRVPMLELEAGIRAAVLEWEAQNMGSPKDVRAD